jgi:hypothetical protein
MEIPMTATLTTTDYNLIATDGDSIDALGKASAKLGSLNAADDVKIEGIKTRKTVRLLGQAPMAFHAVLQTGGDADRSVAQIMSQDLGIAESHVSKVRQVVTAAMSVAGAIPVEDLVAAEASTLTQAKLIDWGNRLEAWWALETAGTPLAGKLADTLGRWVGMDGSDRLQAVEDLRTVFGSVERLYKVGSGAQVHPDTPVEDDDDQDDDGEVDWQAMVTNAVNVAKAHGAKVTEVDFIVRSIFNEVD